MKPRRRPNYQALDGEVWVLGGKEQADEWRQTELRP